MTATICSCAAGSSESSGSSHSSSRGPPQGLGDPQPLLLPARQEPDRHIRVRLRADRFDGGVHLAAPGPRQARALAVDAELDQVAAADRQVGVEDALLGDVAGLGAAVSWSRYRRFFTVMPELPEATLTTAVEVDHTDHEALVAVPLLSAEIVGECRFIRRAGQPDTADAGVTVIDQWQGRGLGSALLTRLSERALEVGVDYFAAEILAENRTMLALLPSLGRVETDDLAPW